MRFVDGPSCIAHGETPALVFPACSLETRLCIMRRTAGTLTSSGCSSMRELTLSA